MEKFFIVTDKARIHADYYDYEANLEKVNEAVKEFLSVNAIESTQYYAKNDAIYILPTEGDMARLGSVLCAPLENGLRKFKSSSKIGKDWTSRLKNAGLKVIERPRPIFYFRAAGGRFRSRLFDQGGLLYCSMNPVIGEPPEGLVEIKASEFYKVLESEPA